MATAWADDEDVIGVVGQERCADDGRGMRLGRGSADDGVVAPRPLRSARAVGGASGFGLRRSAGGGGLVVPPLSVGVGMRHGATATYSCSTVDSPAVSRLSEARPGVIGPHARRLLPPSGPLPRRALPSRPLPPRAVGRLPGVCVHGDSDRSISVHVGGSTAAASGSAVAAADARRGVAAAADWRGKGIEMWPRPAALAAYCAIDGRAPARAEPSVVAPATSSALGTAPSEAAAL